VGGEGLGRILWSRRVRKVFEKNLRTDYREEKSDGTSNWEAIIESRNVGKRRRSDRTPM